MTKFEIKLKEKEKMISSLYTLLSLEFILWIKFKKYHWNIEWKKFNELHLFFEEEYNKSNLTVDSIAERIRTLWEKIEFNVKDFVKKSIININQGLELFSNKIWQINCSK